MESALSTLSDEIPPSPNPVPHHLQSRYVAQRILRAREQIAAAQQDAELGELLESHGYASAQLVEGMALQIAAQNAYTARQNAIGAYNQARRTRSLEARRVWQTYMRFRLIARGLFLDADTRVALGVSHKLPRDAEAWLTHAQASYTTALNTPAYLEVLEEHGYPTAILQTNLQDIENIVALSNEVRMQRAQAVRATENRTLAHTALEVWLTRMRAVAQYATHARPDLWRKLNA